MWQWIADNTTQFAEALGKSALDILFPPLCHVCRTFIPNAGDLHLCASCLGQNRSIISPLCVQCGIPFLTEAGIDHRCAACLTSPPPFTAARAAVDFSGPVKEMIHNFKYEHKVQLRRPLGILTAQRLQDFAISCAPDILIPVPLHNRRLRQRSFNQAVLLAEVLAKYWQLPLCRTNLQRIRWTEPQISLDARERRANVRGAFAVASAELLNGKRVILVDDVYTTGSTVAECAKVLRKAGAAAVYVVTTARAAYGG